MHNFRPHLKSTKTSLQQLLLQSNLREVEKRVEARCSDPARTKWEIWGVGVVGRQVERLNILCSGKKHCKIDNVLYIPIGLERIYVRMEEVLLHMWELFKNWFIYSFTQQILIENLLYTIHWRTRESVVNKPSRFLLLSGL